MKFEYYIVIFLVLIVSGGIVIKKMKRLQRIAKQYEESNERLHEVNYKLREELNKDKRTTSKLEVSLNNLENALNYKIKDDHKSHFFTKELEEGQTIAILFEEEMEHTAELQEKYTNKGMSPLKFSRSLECIVFVDSKKERPLLIDKIFPGQVKVTIGDINCDNYKNRGIGSHVVQSLCVVLKGMGMKEVDASLSTVDYHNKNKLYNFYLKKNGFDLVRELTEDNWGLVSKKIVD